MTKKKIISRIAREIRHNTKRDFVECIKIAKVFLADEMNGPYWYNYLESGFDIDNTHEFDDKGAKWTGYIDDKDHQQPKYKVSEELYKLRDKYNDIDKQREEKRSNAAAIQSLLYGSCKSENNIKINKNKDKTPLKENLINIIKNKTLSLTEKYTMLYKELSDDIIEYNGESCVWCKNESNCPNKKLDMEATRQTIKKINSTTKAYCSIKITCDYYVKDEDMYRKIYYPEGPACQG